VHPPPQLARTGLIRMLLLYASVDFSVAWRMWLLWLRHAGAGAGAGRTNRERARRPNLPSADAAGSADSPLAHASRLFAPLPLNFLEMMRACMSAKRPREALAVWRHFQSLQSTAASSASSSSSSSSSPEPSAWSRSLTAAEHAEFARLAELAESWADVERMAARPLAAGARAHEDRYGIAGGGGGGHYHSRTL
jgi:hypothetical protein